MSFSDDDSYEGGDFGDFFQEPKDFLPPPKPPAFSEHHMRSGQVLKVRTVGNHPLYVRAKQPSPSLRSRAEHRVASRRVLNPTANF